MTDKLPEASENDSIEGQSFYAAHLVGSGTILADGTYGPPMPDPNVLDPENAIYVPDEAPRTGRARHGRVHEAAPSSAQALAEAPVPTPVETKPASKANKSTPATSK